MYILSKFKKICFKFFIQFALLLGFPNWTILALRVLGQHGNQKKSDYLSTNEAMCNKYRIISNLSQAYVNKYDIRKPWKKSCMKQTF